VFRRAVNVESRSKRGGCPTHECAGKATIDCVFGWIFTAGLRACAG